MVTVLTIAPADFTDPRLASFLQAHLDDLAPTAPPESRHALALGALRRPGIHLWVAHDEQDLVGTVALASLSPTHDELKSMRTDPTRRGQGIGSQLVRHALADARRRGVTRVSLETGSMDFFAAARSLYRRLGFVECDPFGSYAKDPNSTFMTIDL